MSRIFSNICSPKSQLMFRIKGTVFLKIWPQIIFICLYTTAVVSVHKFVPGMAMDFTPTIVPILGLVIGLLLAFRTNTAYDRYYEGRRIWSMMTYNIRVLARYFWIGGKERDKAFKGDNYIEKDNCANKEVNEDDETTRAAKDLIERATAMNLLVAFAYSTKNYLREEYSYDADDDIKELISHVPRFQNIPSLKPQTSPADENELQMNSNPNHTREVTVTIEEDSDSNRNVPNIRQKSIPRLTMSVRRRIALAKIGSGGKSHRRRDSHMAHEYVKPTNIPLELAYYIDSYCTRLGIEWGAMYVNNLMECLTQFERILRTPMPLAYSVHLHHSLWLYLLTLPFQLVNILAWMTVPVLGLVTFALLGILAIGWEIENPFGYDYNDLPLDDFCEVIRQEIDMIMGHEVPKPESWTFTSLNKPFVPKSYDSALDLKEMDVKELRGILATGYQDHLYWNQAF